MVNLFGEDQAVQDAAIEYLQILAIGNVRPAGSISLRFDFARCFRRPNAALRGGSDEHRQSGRLLCADWRRTRIRRARSGGCGLGFGDQSDGGTGRSAIRAGRQGGAGGQIAEQERLDDRRRRPGSNCSNWERRQRSNRFPVNRGLWRQRSSWRRWAPRALAAQQIGLTALEVWFLPAIALEVTAIALVGQSVGRQANRRRNQGGPRSCING